MAQAIPLGKGKIHRNGSGLFKIKNLHLPRQGSDCTWRDAPFSVACPPKQSGHTSMEPQGAYMGAEKRLGA